LNSIVIKNIFKVTGSSDLEFNSEGELYTMNTSIREKSLTGYYFEDTFKNNFTIDQKGKISKSSNYKFPFISGVPFYPGKQMTPGEVIDSTGDAVIDLDNGIKNIRIPVIVYTKYIGKRSLYSKSYDFFQINYGYMKLKNPDQIIKADAIHKIDFYYDGINHIPVYMEDHFSEEFTTYRNDKIKRSGFCDYFYSTVVLMDRNKILKELTENLKNKDDSFTIEKRDEGIAIVINNLQFKPDSTKLLDEDEGKLDQLYGVLKNIVGRTFKITGHTALSGTYDEQMKLSVDRAKSVAEFLIKKGINPDRIIYTGKGASEPIASNDTEENMKKNRRVEIVIMED
jgi:outer membrane protein OmpA-like peptidoglycan-associated protein